MADYQVLTDDDKAEIVAASSVVLTAGDTVNVSAFTLTLT